VWIDPMHKAAMELLSDANYYASGTGFDFADSRRIINGAKQTKRALLKAGTPSGQFHGWSSSDRVLSRESNNPEPNLS
jgi:hypothetical protein